MMMVAIFRVGGGGWKASVPWVVRWGADACGGRKPPFHGLRYVFRSISVHLSELVFVESMEGKVPLLGSELYWRFKEVR